jgi:outer membrane protein assembly factor BamB
MKNSKGKTAAAIMIAVLLIISIGASTTLLPPANAHVPSQQLTTNAYITAFPDPVGKGQSTLIYMWLNRVFGYYPAGEIAGSINYAAVNNNYRFHNYQLTITDPDGKNTTQTFDIIQDTTSSQSYSFTPTVVGTYTLTFNFPGQAYNQYAGQYNPNSVLVNDTYLPSSATTKLTVQENDIFRYPSSYPLPEQYWTRPIYGENSGWWTISSNWLGTGAPGYGGFTVSYNLGGNGAVFYAGDSVGPQTSHVMWTKPMQSGGIVGGNKFEIQGNAYFEGSAYNQRYQNPIVVNGKIYFTEPVSFTGSNSGPTDCVDLRTGQLLWSRKDVPPLSFGFIWDHEDPNQHGVYPAILATANFARLFDADTGEPLFNVTGVPSGTAVLGPYGEHLRYVFTNLGNTTNPNWVLAQWNSTKLWNFGTNPYTGGSLLNPSIINATYLGNTARQALITTVPMPLTGTTATLSNGQTNQPVPYGSTLIVNGGVLNSTDAQNRFDWNVSVPWRNTIPSAPTVVGAIRGDIMLLYNGTLPSQGATFMGTLGFKPYTYFAINLNASRTDYKVGDVMWRKTYDPPAGNITVMEAGIDPVNRVFVEDLRETQTFVGYSLNDGTKLWTTQPQADMDYYGSQASGSLANTFAYGRLYSSAYAGIIYCYDTKTGNRLWTYGNGGAGNNTNSGFEVPGPYPTFINAIGNGIVYAVTSEHTVEMPIFKGALSRAINATDGTEIWSISSYVTEFTTTSYAIADGYATWFNSYDNSIYTVGRGPTKTTVEAPKAAITLGGSLVITGTVVDISAGTKQNQQAINFPNGVPAMSDASMTEWMGYVYQQKPHPTNSTGVVVILTVTDANNNTREIGRTTTDASGTYSFQYTPDIPGKYTILAQFDGTNGYWPSAAETAFAVDPAAEPTPPVQIPAEQSGTYVMYAAIAIIITIVIVGAVIILVLRKRP